MFINGTWRFTWDLTASRNVATTSASPSIMSNSFFLSII
jgi:hypothetical protein